jgi:hypothetical protein
MVGAGGVNTVLVAHDLGAGGRGEAALRTRAPGQTRPRQARAPPRTSQNLAPIWLPHWPPWMWTISRIAAGWGAGCCWSDWGLGGEWARARSKSAGDQQATGRGPPPGLWGRYGRHGGAVRPPRGRGGRARAGLPRRKSQNTPRGIAPKRPLTVNQSVMSTIDVLGMAVSGRGGPLLLASRAPPAAVSGDWVAEQECRGRRRGSVLQPWERPAPRPRRKCATTHEIHNMHARNGAQSGGSTS